MINYIVKIAFLSTVFLVGCSPKNNADEAREESPGIRLQVEEPKRNAPSKVKEGNEEVFCGNNSTRIKWQISAANNNDTGRFAILLNGSPVTQYFGDQSPQSEQMVEKLVERGFKVFEIKYPTPYGFYSVCARQGIQNIAQHCADVYDVAVKHLGFDSLDPKHTLAGVGWSIGAIQLQAMSFMMGKRVDKIALMGVLMGDVDQGCKSFFDGKNDGYSWAAFHDLASFLTSNGKGCFSPSEYTSRLSFENQKYFDKWSLGIFEGESKVSSILESRVAGNIAQAQHIAQKRKEAGVQVDLYSYPDCGHELMECTKGKVADDMLKFIDK